MSDKQKKKKRKKVINNTNTQEVGKILKIKK